MPTPPRPSHLVISLDDNVPIGQVLLGLVPQSSALRLAAVRSTDPEGADIYPARGDNQSRPRLYPQFNLAALPLDEAEAAQLRSPTVLVVPNEERTIQGWPARRSPADPAPPASIRNVPIPDPEPGDGDEDDEDDCGGHRCIPGRRSTPASGGDRNRLRDYVAGQRDAMNAVLRRLGGAGASANAPIPQTHAGLLEWHLEAVGLHPGYARLGEGVKVAVLDTGLDPTHPDFIGRILPANCRSFIAGVDSVADGNGHGTHCCGLVNGPLLPKSGPRYGAAPAAELLVGKVLSDQGRGYDSDIIAGIAWAAQQGARIISLSLGSSRRPGDPAAAGYEQIARHLALAGLDCLLVAAAGNDSRRSAGRLLPVGNPAGCPSFLAVAAIDSTTHVAEFSNAELDTIGTLELSAPGVDVRSSVPGSLAADPGEPYDLYSGTSMATPLVAGVATLWRQASPKLTALELWRELIRHARPAGSRRDFGFGLAQVP